jgi:hypothetical protein
MSRKVAAVGMKRLLWSNDILRVDSSTVGPSPS